MRILCVLLPHFPLRCELRRDPGINDRAAVVTRASGAQKLVFDYSPELDGLQCGMPVQQALSHYGDVELVQADMPGYWHTFNGLLGQAGKEAPLIGIAEGKFPAYLAALNSPAGGCRVLGDDTSAFLAEMPCDVLPLRLKTREKLHSFGLHTLGQVAALPAGPLQAQFGPEGKRLAGLARGIDTTPLNPRLFKQVIEESTTLLSVTASGTSREIEGLGNGTPVTAAGLVICRQRPRRKVVFITLEDEFGHIPLMVFPPVYERYENDFKSPFLIIRGTLTRREGTHNVVVSRVKPFRALDKAPQSKDWC
jgi:hypothetical protein